MIYPIHAGQLRYHDFEALRRKETGRRGRLNVPFSSVRHLSFSVKSPLSSRTALSTIPSVTIGMTDLRPLLSSTTLSEQQQRTFFTAFSKFRKLKGLEYQARKHPNDPNVQSAFLTALLNEGFYSQVVDRFENHAGFAVDERVAYAYLEALQNLPEQAARFHPRHFARRLKDGGHTSGLMVSIGSDTVTELDKIGVKSDAGVAKAMEVLRVSMARSGIGGTGFVGGLPSTLARLGHDPSHPLHVEVSNAGGGASSGFWTQVFRTVRVGVVLFVAYSAFGALLDERGVGRAMGLGKDAVQEADGSDVRFDDVKGVDEAKAELEEIVLYLKDPTRFTRLGGKLPRGLLLTGPPGTGKTMLAKAIAGEAGVPFFFSSGSQFEEVYVGLGAKRVRDLFAQAKKKAPAIIFIDEIDAVGGSRKLKDQSALKMTLNELLVQMDGFDENNGIIVVGATNFAESLDSALLRPGRFDKQVSVPLPDVGGRKEILKAYAVKTKLAKDVDLDILARGTVGFSGADLYNLMNQAALKASVDGLNSITMEIFEYAKDKILMGAERKTAVITPKTARCTAFHEAGHALVAVLTEGAQPIHKATIMPRGQALGMVTMLPEGDQTSQSYQEMVATMDVCMGGRVAEELVFGKEQITSGASSDIMSATRIARAMVTKFGFSEEVGVVYHGGGVGEESASSKTRAHIDEEVKKMTDGAYRRATELLKKHKRQHYLLAETLLEYETLTGDEVREIIYHNRKPNRPIVNTQKGAKGDQTLAGPTKGGTSKTLPGSAGVVGSRRERKE